jgi:hypothetical protein
MSSPDKLVHAVEHLNAARASRPEVALLALVDEAARQFDLDAAQSEWLLMTALRLRDRERGEKPREGDGG